MQSDINQYKPGTKMAITEYNYGGGNDISGAIAEADVLGIFGKKDVYAAAWWNIEGAGNTDFTFAAMDMFRNYDGAGGRFGDTSVDATTNNIANSAVYASIDANNPNRMTLVAINRTDQPLNAAMAGYCAAAQGHGIDYAPDGTDPNPGSGGADIRRRCVRQPLRDRTGAHHGPGQADHRRRAVTDAVRPVALAVHQ